MTANHPTVAHWAETQTDEEARALDRRTWEFTTRAEPGGTVVSQASGPPSENGEFWLHALERIKDDPDQRYTMAKRHLPLPAAWREMALSLRAKIRKARKEKVAYEDLLRELHHLAAMSSYAEYGTIERVPYARLAALDLSYARIGFERLNLLCATDGKWMRDLWGDPSEHTTAAKLYEEVLFDDLERIDADRKAESAEWTELLFGENALNTRLETSRDQHPSEPKRRRWLSWLIG